MNNQLPLFRVVLDNVAARRGGRLAFAGATLTLSPCDIFVLRGPNGAGKSTLLRVLAGRVRPNEGVMEIADGTLVSSTTLLAHTDGLKNALSAEETLRFWRDLYGAEESRLERATKAMDLSSFRRQRASTLSAGQRRRVAMCRPIISGRPIWLLDEPTAGMDAASVKRVIAAVEDHARSGGAAVIATHEPLEIKGARAITMSEAA